MIIGLIPGLLAAGCARSVTGQAVAASGTVATTGGATTTEPTTSADGPGTTSRPSTSGSVTPPADADAVDLAEFLDRLQAANEQVTSTVGTFDLQGPDRSFTSYTVTQKDGVAQDWELGYSLPDDPESSGPESGTAGLEVTVRLVDGRTYLSGNAVQLSLGATTQWVTPAPGTGGEVADLAEALEGLRLGLGPEFVDQVSNSLTSVRLVDTGEIHGLAADPVDAWHYQGEADPRELIDVDSDGGPVTMDLFLDAEHRVVRVVFSQSTDDGEIVGTIQNTAFDTVPAIETPAPADVTTR